MRSKAVKILLNNKLISCLLWIIGLTCLTFNTLAQQPQNKPMTSAYKQVEIIIFSKIRPNALLSEQWKMPTSMPDVNHAIKLSPFDSQKPDNALPQLLPPNDWKLNKIVKRLSNHGYTIIFHVAWIQDFFAKFNYPIHLFIPEHASSTPTTTMNGTIDITLNRYFNVAIDLILGEPINDLTSVISSKALEKNFYNIKHGVAYFQLKQNRRMKSDELNYIDHPLYGILIKIMSF